MNINMNLVTQEPIIFNGIKIYQSTFQEILDYGIEDFYKLILPYSLTFDLLNIPEEEQNNSNLFEDIITKDETMFGLLLISLNYFCRTEDISVSVDGIKVGNGIVNKHNFDELSNIMLEMNSREKPKVEQPPKFTHEKGTPEYEEGYKKWLQIQANRKKFAGKDELRLENIIKTVRFGGKSYIPLEEIKKMTLWTLMDAYKSILQIDSYEKNFSTFLIDMEHKTDRITPHWTEQIKI